MLQCHFAKKFATEQGLSSSTDTAVMPLDETLTSLYLLCCLSMNLSLSDACLLAPLTFLPLLSMEEMLLFTDMYSRYNDAS
jgi:hypothetical protein